MTTLDLVWPNHRELVGAFPAFEPRRDALSQFRKALAEGFAQLVPPLGRRRPWSASRRARTAPLRSAYSCIVRPLVAPRFRRSSMCTAEG